MDFLKLTKVDKINLVADLRATRHELLKKALRKKSKKKRKKKIRVKFDNPELEKIFHSMSDECKDLREEMGDLT